MHELGFVDELRSLLQNEITPLDVVIGKRRFTPDRSLHPAGRAVLSGDRFERIEVEHQDFRGAPAGERLQQPEKCTAVDNDPRIVPGILGVAEPIKVPTW
jgi:hypothetical protein